MLHRCLATTLAAIVTGTTHDGPADVPATPFHVGETTRTFHPQAERHRRGTHTQTLITNIQYPVDISVPEVSHSVDAPGRSPLRMQPSVSRVPIASTQAQRPLLLFSHGTGGTASSFDRMAAALAANGYIVADINHPGSTALEPFMRDGFMPRWGRTTDVNEMLDGVLADPMLGAHVDRMHIGAVGFSLGGYTILELTGARTDIPAFMAFCGSPQADTICHPPEMARAQISPTVGTMRSSQTEASLACSGASYCDARIKAVFAMAPILGMAMDATSLGSISIPVSLMAGDADIAVPADTNVRRVAKMLPKADLLLVPGASHCTFMDTCLSRAAPRVSLLCGDSPGIDRNAVHAEAVRRALDFFGAVLPGQT